MIDINLDINFDVDIFDGDFVVKDAREQDILLICKANRGHFYQWPKLGAGIDSLLNSNIGRNELAKIIRENLIQDKFTVRAIEVQGDRGSFDVYIDAI